jgi:gamma-glutamyl hercynylcysteine S-oxide synthase
MPSFGNIVDPLSMARRSVDRLFGMVVPESLYERPIPLRHRLVFYIGHVEAFDRNLIATVVPDLPQFAPELDRLFAFGIDPESGTVPSDMPEDWPELEAISGYCKQTRAIVDRAWDGVPAQLRHVALEHRFMHAETLTYLLHAMCPEHLVGTPGGYESGEVPASQMLPVESGMTELGQINPGEFGWDNEFEPHSVCVDAFRMSRYKVTNGEYLRFVEDGGTPSHFWLQRKGEWRLRRMFDEIPLPMNWPVYVTQEQAAAFASWRGLSLPTEEQWQRAAYPDRRAYPWGGKPPDNQTRWDPQPVDAAPDSASPFGIEGLIGNGWEWTSSPFRPFPGFKRFPFYPGYSADFFDNDHFVLKGGSPCTDAVFLRRSFRNWFRSDYPYVFATFRCIHNQD